MLARCARCQGTFTTDHYGRQICPHCGSELILPEPAVPPGQGAQPPPAPPEPQAQPPQGGSAEPPPAAYGPPPGGAPPPEGWGPPPPQPGPGPGPAGWGAYPPPGAFGGPEAPSPFAERARRGFFAAFFETWKLVATQPQQFFARVRIDQTGTAVLFGVIAATVGNAAAAVYGYFSGQQALLALQPMIQNMPEEQARFMRLYMQALSGGSTLAQLVLAPLLTVIGMYVGSAILHLLLLLFRGATRGFDATLTVVAYANGINLLLAVPACGWFLAVVWGLVATIIGLGAIHRCGTGKAAAAVLAPAALACVCCCAIAGLSAPALLERFKDAAPQTDTTTL